MTFDELQQEALKLPFDEREILAHILYDSLKKEPVDPEVERAILEEVRRRDQAIREGRTKLISAEELLSGLLKEDCAYRL